LVHELSKRQETVQASHPFSVAPHNQIQGDIPQGDGIGGLVHFLAAFSASFRKPLFDLPKINSQALDSGLKLFQLGGGNMKKFV